MRRRCFRSYLTIQQAVRKEHKACLNWPLSPTYICMKTGEVLRECYVRPPSVHQSSIYFHIYSFHRGMDSFTHTYSHTPILSDHLQTFTCTHRGKFEMCTPAQLLVCGWWEESGAPGGIPRRQRTCKPHMERISCLGTELFISCGCDHF